MYGVGSWVRSSRASPTNPICDSGSRLKAASAMPSPARSTGTSSGGSASAVPVVGATGVVIGTPTTASVRAASYTNRVASSRSAARNSALLLRSSRITVSRAWAIGCCTTVVSTCADPRRSGASRPGAPKANRCRRR